MHVCSSADFKLLYFVIVLLFYHGEIFESFLSYAFFYLSRLLTVCCTFVKLNYLNLLFSSFSLTSQTVRCFHSIKDNGFEVPLRSHTNYCCRNCLVPKVFRC